MRTGDAVSDEVPDDAAEAGVEDGLEEDVLDVLGADRARREHGKAGLHEEDQSGRPHQVEGVELRTEGDKGDGGAGERRGERMGTRAREYERAVVEQTLSDHGASQPQGYTWTRTSERRTRGLRAASTPCVPPRRPARGARALGTSRAAGHACCWGTTHGLGCCMHVHASYTCAHAGTRARGHAGTGARTSAVLVARSASMAVRRCSTVRTAAMVSYEGMATESYEGMATE